MSWRFQCSLAHVSHIVCGWKARAFTEVKKSEIFSVRNGQCLNGLQAQNIYSCQKSMFFCSFWKAHGHTIAAMSHRNCHGHSSLFSLLLFILTLIQHCLTFYLYWTSLLNAIICLGYWDESSLYETLWPW